MCGWVCAYTRVCMTHMIHVVVVFGKDALWLRVWPQQNAHTALRRWGCCRIDPSSQFRVSLLIVALATSHANSPSPRLSTGDLVTNAYKIEVDVVPFAVNTRTFQACESTGCTRTECRRKKNQSTFESG